MIEKEITIKIKATSPIDLKTKIDNLQTISRLDMDDQNRMIEIGKNPKALTALKDNWAFLKGMFT